MKQKCFVKRIMTGLLASAVLFVTMPKLTVSAETDSTYTVTYRPGNVGYFAIPDTKATDKKEMAEEVAQVLYNGAVEEINVTENGAIKLTVKKGDAVPVAPGAYVQTDGKYFAKNASEWGPAEGENVIKNIDFVVDYAKLVNGVEYTVSYVDSESGASIAPVAIAYANIGDVVEITAPASITVSGVARYLLQSTATQKLTLAEAGSASNVLVFEYQAEPTGVNVNEIVEYVEGDVVELIQTVTVNVPGQGGAGAVIAPGQEDAEQQGQEQGAEDQGENQGEIVDIPDEDTPLADSEVKTEDSQNSEAVIIEDEETPLSDGAPNNNIYMYLAVAGFALVAIAAVWFKYVVGVKKLENSEED